jgi:hypothetical protein
MNIPGFRAEASSRALAKRFTGAAIIGLTPINHMFQALHQRFRAHVWKSE